MQTQNAKQESGQHGMGWVFLATYSLDEMHREVEDGEVPVARLRLQESGIPQEFLGPVLQALSDFTQQAEKYVRPGAPAVIRLFCQEKGPQAHHSTEGSASWGFFVVEKTGEPGADRPVNSIKFIDLYVYSEGA